MLVPITTSEAPGARLRGVPETVMLGWPGIKVWVPMRNSVLELVVMMEEPKVIMGRIKETFGARVNVLPLMTTLDPRGARLIGVPDMVIAGLPGDKVWVPMTNSK